jgi:hypothetical protein
MELEACAPIAAMAVDASGRYRGSVETLTD